MPKVFHRCIQTTAQRVKAVELDTSLGTRRMHLFEHDGFEDDRRLRVLLMEDESVAGIPGF